MYTQILLTMSSVNKGTRSSSFASFNSFLAGPSADLLFCIPRTVLEKGNTFEEETLMLIG